MREVMGAVFGKDPHEVGLSVIYDVCHNTAKLEQPRVAINPDELIRIVKCLQPSFGAINLEHIAQPKCFRVLDTLRADPRYLDPDLARRPAGHRDARARRGTHDRHDRHRGGERLDHSPPARRGGADRAAGRLHHPDHGGRDPVRARR
jgi:hypothetical protein